MLTAGLERQEQPDHDHAPQTRQLCPKVHTLTQWRSIFAAYKAYMQGQYWMLHG